MENDKTADAVGAPLQQPVRRGFWPSVLDGLGMGPLWRWLAERQVRQCCDHCDDGDGHSVFPYYGVAPHTHADGPVMGSTRLLPREQWGDNFREDTDAPGAGIYLQCPQCKRGEPETPNA